MSLNCSEVQEVSGRVRIPAILKPFLGSSPFCQDRQSSSGHFEAPSNFLFLHSSKTSNTSAPPSSQGTVWCRSNRVMATLHNTFYVIVAIQCLSIFCHERKTASLRASVVLLWQQVSPKLYALPWLASILSPCQFLSRLKPKRLYGLETDIRPELQYSFISGHCVKK